MGGDKAMIAIGIGCRKGCPAEDVENLLKEALHRASLQHEARLKLYSCLHKERELGLLHAAENLGLPLTFLAQEVLARMNDRVLSVSEKSRELFGVASICEAAALAGAGPKAVLILPRISNINVSCAIARGAFKQVCGG
jgi:cobalt-precorrin 5A hydrolase